MDDKVNKALKAATALRLACDPRGGAFVKFVKLEADAPESEYDGGVERASSACEASSRIISLRESGAPAPVAVMLDDIPNGIFRLTPSARDNGGVGGGRLDGKIAVVTGAAQGFGAGIAESMAREGARVVVADMNMDGARERAEQICALYGSGRAVAAYVNVTDEESVEAMVTTAVLRYGGLDILISNAGALIAGGVDEMTKKNFEFVTSVNYTGYFLCAKHAAAQMKRQRALSPGYTADIIEINSKSGLEGSNRNCAYAGSKFGGIGLTQSFALELVESGVKVNAICPGNLLDGPLWSDPVRGLFKQYLDAGKVPGAKTVSDVRAYYESRVPMGRGCQIEDVARAIFYAVEQQYETGQAIPVTGGQVMLS